MLFWINKFARAILATLRVATGFFVAEEALNIPCYFYIRYLQKIT